MENNGLPEMFNLLNISVSGILQQDFSTFNFKLVFFWHMTSLSSVEETHRFATFQ